MNFSKLFSKKHGTSHAIKQPGLASRFMNDPYVDWTLILFVGLCFGIAAIVGAGYLFLEIKKGQTINGDASLAVPEKVLNPGELSKVVDSFSKKNIMSETVRKTPYTTVADPSL